MEGKVLFQGCSKEIEILRNLQQMLISILTCDENEISEELMKLFVFFNEVSISTNYSIYEGFLHNLSTFSLIFSTRRRKSHKLIDLNVFYDIMKELISKHSLKTVFNQSTLFFLFQNNKHLLHLFVEEGIIDISFIERKIFAMTDLPDVLYGRSLFLYFIPEIKKTHPNLYEKLKVIFYKESAEEYIKYQYTGCGFGNPDPINFDVRKKNHSFNEIAKIIQEDDLDSFMSYISKDDQFNINRVITPSFLENNPEINKGYELYLLDYAAAFGSINIFRYLWMKNAKYSEKLMEYFIIGGNSEIFDFLKKNWIDFNSNCCMLAIEYYYFEIWEYLINNGEFELVPPNSSNIMLIDDNFYGFDDLFGDPLVNQDESKITYVITQPTIGNIISFSSYPLNIEIIYQCFIKNQNKDKVKKTDLMSNIVIDTLEEIYKSFLNSMCPMTFYMLAQFIQHQENIDINLKNKVLYLYSRFILFFKKEFQSNINNTLLHIACFEGQHEITDFLLKQPNIDINAKNNIFLFIQSHIQSIKNIH